MIIVNMWLDWLEDSSLIYLILILEHFLAYDHQKRYFVTDILAALGWGLIGNLIGDSYIVIWLIVTMIFKMIKSRTLKLDHYCGLIKIFSITIVLSFEILEQIIYLVFYNIIDNLTVDLIVFLAIKFVLLFVFVFIIYSFFSKMTDFIRQIAFLKIDKQLFWFSFVLFILWEAAIVFLQIKKLMVQSIFIVFYLYLLFIIFSFFMSRLYIRSYLANADATQKLKQDKELRQYLKVIESEYDEMRRFKHDYQNILLSLDGFVKEQHSPQFDKYYQELLKQQPIKQDLRQSTIANIDYLQNDPIRGLIIQKFLLAKESNISLDIELMQPIFIKANNILAIVRIIGALLDNALEQVQQTSAKMFRCAFNADDDTVTIMIDNQCNQLGNIHQLFNAGYTTKDDHEGLGLSNVQKLIRQEPNLLLNTHIVGDHLRISLTVIN